MGTLEARQRPGRGEPAVGQHAHRVPARAGGHAPAGGGGHDPCGHVRHEQQRQPEHGQAPRDAARQRGVQVRARGARLRRGQDQQADEPEGHPERHGGPASDHGRASDARAGRRHGVRVPIDERGAGPRDRPQQQRPRQGRQEGRTHAEAPDQEHARGRSGDLDRGPARHRHHQAGRRVGHPHRGPRQRPGPAEGPGGPAGAAPGDPQPHHDDRRAQHRRGPEPDRHGLGGAPARGDAGQVEHQGDVVERLEQQRTRPGGGDHRRRRTARRPQEERGRLRDGQARGRHRQAPDGGAARRRGQIRSASTDPVPSSGAAPARLPGGDATHRRGYRTSRNRRNDCWSAVPAPDIVNALR